MKKRLFYIITATVLLLTGCSEKKNTIKIAYLPITHSLSVLETVEQSNKSPELNIELVRYGSWPELLDALNSNRVDGASVLIELAMKSKQEGIGIKAVALGQTSRARARAISDASARRSSRGRASFRAAPRRTSRPRSARAWSPI